MNKNDVKILRELAARVAEIASSPIQEEKKVLWRGLNGLKPIRPMVMIDQICWHELNVDNELTLQCIEPECRKYEEHLRRIIYQWTHFPVDMVVESCIRVPKAVRNTGFGIGVKEETAVTDPSNTVVGHKYINQLMAEDDLEKIKTPYVHHDIDETNRRLGIASELFDGLLEVKSQGVDPYLSLWDPIATWMGVENALYALVDKPDFVHRLLNRLTDGYLSMLDQLQEQGLLCEPQRLIHCSGAYCDELPAPGYNPQKPRTKDIWMFGLAQMFSTVSPKMFKEFEVDYTSRICERFGLVYYGCCDPLDGKMDEVRMIPNVRKVSMSAWVNQESGAEKIRGDYVYSRKPNPAFVATKDFDEDQIREDIATTIKICDRYGCPVEFILKDISTVRYESWRLSKWASIVMNEVGA